LIAKNILDTKKNIVLEPHWITHSNIQDIGIALSVSETIRNVFNGAETLEASVRGNIGASRDLANPNNRFLTFQNMELI
jgi:hypothetical protein